LEKRARERGEKEREKYEAKCVAREQREGIRKGVAPKAISTKARGVEQCNLSDKDSRLILPSLQEAFMQAYNAQACVDAGVSQLVLGAHVSQCASDSRELIRAIASIPPEAGQAKQVVADRGYACGEDIEALEKGGLEVYVSVQSEARQMRRKHDYRPVPKKVCREIGSGPRSLPWISRMAKKLATEQGRKIYALRKQTVEPVFGIVKQAMGFRQFLLRGLSKVEGEWKLVLLAYNFRRLHVLMRA
jgi:hypothetical protein